MCDTPERVRSSSLGVGFIFHDSVDQEEPYGNPDWTCLQIPSWLEVVQRPNEAAARVPPGVTMEKAVQVAAAG